MATSASFSGRPVVRAPAPWHAGNRTLNVPQATYTPGRPVPAPTGRSGFTQTGAVAGPPAPPKAPTVPPAPAWTPPDLSGNKWQAYLNPDQLAALRTAGTNTGAQIGAQQRQESDAQAAYQQNVNDNAYAAAQQTSAANDAAAGRGMFLSSARANDLTDIQRSLVERQTTAKANLDTVIFNATNAIDALTNNYNTTVNQYQGWAASQVPTPPPPPAPGPTAPNRSPIPGPAPPGHGPTGASFQQTGASTGPARPGAKTPGRPPTVGRNQIGYHGGF